MIVVPMVFSALVIGVYELGRGHDLPGVAGRTLVFTLVLSAASVLVGVMLVNALRPGDGLELGGAALPGAAGVEALQANAAAAQAAERHHHRARCRAIRSIRPFARSTARCCRSWCSR